MKTLSIFFTVLALVLAALAVCALAACAFAAARRRRRTKSGPPRRGGAAGGRGTPRRGAAVTPRRHTPHRHSLGTALHDYARTLGPEHALEPHPLERDHYGPHGRGGGAAPAAKSIAKPIAKPKKPWTDYGSWEELQKDEGAYHAYFQQRSDVLNNPDLDWGAVLADMEPKLREDREHIGVVNLDADGRTLRIVASEASPLIAGEMDSETAFAGVPGELVAKYAARPGLIIFHTHPADPRASPLPSSHDLATAIYFGATSRFAACAVISRYGVLVHGLDWAAYKALHEAKDWKLAVLSLSHDVVAAHEAVRSWSSWTVEDYLKFYPRHRMLMFVYPSPTMVGDSRRFSYLGNLESPIDHDLIREYGSDITDHRAQARKSANRAQRAPAVDHDMVDDYGHTPFVEYHPHDAAHNLGRQLADEGNAPTLIPIGFD
jgi:hypothetical protein